MNKLALPKVEIVCGILFCENNTKGHCTKSRIGISQSGNCGSYELEKDE